MTLEDDLRTTLLDRAGRDAPGPDLVASVSSGIRRDRRRRRILATALAAAVVVAGLTPVLLRDRAVSKPPPVAATTPPPTFETPVFPLRTGWLPDGVGGATVSQMGPNVNMSYTYGSATLSIEIGPLPADWETEAPDVHQGEVNGVKAEVHVADDFDGARPGERFAGVRWRWPDGRLVSVLSWGKVSEKDVLRIAEGLTGGGTTPVGAVPFRLPFTPAGLVPQFIDDANLCLAPPAVVREQRTPAGLCFTLGDREEYEPEMGYDTWSVDGRRVQYDPEVAFLRIDWSDSSQIDVHWDPETISITREQAVALANGVRPR